MSMVGIKRLRLPKRVKIGHSGAAILYRWQRRFSSSSGQSPQGSILSRVWHIYTEALIAYPLKVKTAVASIIFFASDSATQYVTDPTSDWSPARALSGSMFGVVSTTWLHYWWGFLEGFVGGRIPVANYRLTNALVKVFVDQSIGAPLYIYTYYLLTHFLQELHLQTKWDTAASANLLKSTHERASEMLLPVSKCAHLYFGKLRISFPNNFVYLAVEGNID